MFRLTRRLNVIFEDATEIEMRKAHACGDLCCICLGSMLGANVKKLKCGHLYHSHCLRKVSIASFECFSLSDVVVLVRNTTNYICCLLFNALTRLWNEPGP